MEASIELQDFINNAVSQIENGTEVGKRSLNGAIEFEISIAKTEKLNGNIKIYVAQGGGEISKESIAKIKFQVYPKYPEDASRGKFLQTDEKNWSFSK